MIKIYYKIICIISIILIISCHKDNHSYDDSAEYSEEIQFMINKLMEGSGGTIFTSDLSAFNFNPITKSSKPAAITGLKWEQSKSKVIKNFTYTAVEIEQDGSVAFFSTYESEAIIPSQIKKYLICKQNNDNDSLFFYIKTYIILDNFITEADAVLHANTVFDPFNLSDFSGLIINSKINSKFISANIVTHKRVYPIRFLKPYEDIEEMSYKLYISTKLTTKSDDEEWRRELDEAYVIADGKGNKDPNDPIYDNENDDPFRDSVPGHEIDDSGEISEGGPSGGPFEYTVELTHSTGGETHGSGTFRWGTLVNVTAIPHNGCVFLGWHGDLSGQGTNRNIKIHLLKDIVAHAQFKRVKPCIEVNRADPLLNMAIRSTKRGNTNSGRHNGIRIRNGKDYIHEGLDLIVKHDTPIFSMFDGVITKIVSGFDPSVEWKKYEEKYDWKYSRSQQSAGNQITIDCVINGQVVKIIFMHLDNIDPNLKVGDNILAGTILGHGGSTGSAGSDDAGGPHLHIYVVIDGKRVEVEGFIYTIFDKDGNAIRFCE